MLRDVSAETSPEGAERFQLVLHATVDDLAGSDTAHDTGAGSELASPGGGSARVHPATARRLSCDCPTTHMVDAVDGSAVHVGRKTRRIRGRLRRAVHARDRGRCRAPGCTERATQIHHVRHWANGGTTCLPNLISLCDSHHWVVHEGGFALAIRGPGEWVLIGPTGVIVGPRPDRAEANNALPVDPTVAADAVTGHWQGDRLHAQPIIQLVAAAAVEPKSVSAETPSPVPAASPSGPPAAQPGPLSREVIDRWVASVEEMTRRAATGPVLVLDEDDD